MLSLRLRDHDPARPRASHGPLIVITASPTIMITIMIMRPISHEPDHVHAPAERSISAPAWPACMCPA